jgi:hypothetical protein
MTKIKVQVKAGTNGKPLGKRVAQMRAEQGRNQKGDKVLYRPKAKLTTHIRYAE